MLSKRQGDQAVLVDIPQVPAAEELERAGAGDDGQVS